MRSPSSSSRTTRTKGKFFWKKYSNIYLCFSIVEGEIFYVKWDFTFRIWRKLSRSRKKTRRRKGKRTSMVRVRTLMRMLLLPRSLMIRFCSMLVLGTKQVILSLNSKTYLLWSQEVNTPLKCTQTTQNSTERLTIIKSCIRTSSKCSSSQKLTEMIWFFSFSCQNLWTRVRPCTILFWCKSIEIFKLKSKLI